MNMNIRSITRDEIGAVLDLIQGAFTYYTDTADEKNGREHYEMFADVYNRADIDTDLIVVAEEQGKFVSMVSFLPKRLHMGGQELPGVILSPAGTVLDSRKQKLADRVIRYGLNLAKQKGYVFSNVLGHPDYYPRFGYESVFPWYRLEKECKVAEAKTDVEHLQVRFYQKDDLEAITAIYYQEMDKHVFYPVRSKDWFERELAVMTGEAGGQRMGHAFVAQEDFLVFTRGDEVIGYAYVGDTEDNMQVKECLLAQYEYAEDVFQALQHLALTRQKKSLVCAFPAVTHFGLYMKAQGAQEIAFAPSAWMMQVLDWQQWFDAYGATTPLAKISGHPVDIRVEQQEPGLMRLRIECGEQLVECSLNQTVLNQLACGLYTVEEVTAMGHATMLQGDPTVLSALFPKRAPYFNLSDCLF